MFGKLASLVSGSSENPESWVEWQKNKPSSHFQRSEAFHYFYTLHPDFVPIEHEGVTNDYYCYCLGQFKAFAPSGWIGVVTRDRLLSFLLKFYDSCKGFGRSLLWGDPPGIQALRLALEKGEMESLSKINFSSLVYDYTVLHSHTVAVFSLSTLVLSLAAHVLSRTTTHSTFPSFELRLCKKALEMKIFGSFIRETRSSAIEIPESRQPIEIAHGSWPNNFIAAHTCVYCHRKTEKLWGSNHSCLDCHMEKICSICGSPFSCRGSDGFPRCLLHSYD